jgi:hypothetical protein
MPSCRSSGKKKQPNETKAPSRPSDDTWQHARAWRAAASAVRGEDNAVEHTLVVAYLFWSADVSATVSVPASAFRRIPIALHSS